MTDHEEGCLRTHITGVPCVKKTSPHQAQDMAELVAGERHRVYGDASDTFEQIGVMWSALVGADIKATDVALMMMLLKTVRARQAPDYSDNTDDIVGYVEVFRKIVGDDMVHAKSVTDYVDQKVSRQLQEDRNALPGSDGWKRRFGGTPPPNDFQKCGAWAQDGEQGCILFAGHNRGQVDVPSNHQFEGR